MIRTIAVLAVALGVVVAFLSGGCASMPMPEVDRFVLAAAVAQGASTQQVEHGRRLMVTSCAACHTPVHPLAISMSDWDDAIPRMVREARLGPTDGRDIRAYVMAVRTAANRRRTPEGDRRASRMAPE